MHGSPYAEGEKCSVCVEPASHKVGEEDNVARAKMHNYTAYLCCRCFGTVMGAAAKKECFHGK